MNDPEVTHASYSYEQIAGLLDHSLLMPTLTRAELEAGCRLARAYSVASVCILPYAVARCADTLAGSEVRTSTTVGFPHGGHSTAVKVAEAERALDDGATELDMVVNISAVRSESWDLVRSDLAAVIGAAHARRGRVKVIFENAYLSDDQKVRLCELCGELRADWAKTSTGYAPGGATHDDLRLMRRHCPAHVQIKAAGGVRDLDAVLAVRELGVTRIGASRTAEILDDCRRRLGLGPVALDRVIAGVATTSAY